MSGNTGKIVLGGTALALAAIALAQKKVQAASLNVVNLDNETTQLLIALAQSSADIEVLLGRLLAVEGAEGGPINLQVAGYPPNADSIIAARVQVGALNTAYQLPDIPVPEGMVLQICGWPTNGGLIYVGRAQATAINPNSVWPLLPGAAIGYAVRNAKALWVSGTVVGDFAGVTVEQRG